MSIKKPIVVLVVMPFIFLAIMIGLQLIPNSWVKDNVEKSREIIRVESIYHDAYYVPGIHWLAASDGYSDDIYLEEQIVDRTHSVFHGAMIPNYARYWHGYSLFLRPLLVFFDLSYIRQLLVISFMLLMAVLVYLIIKHINFTIGILFTLAIALVNPPIIMISLQYSNMFLLTLAASIVMMIMIAKKRPFTEILVFFATLGSLTSFFDLLTTPSITLGIPLLLFIAYRIQHDKSKDLLKHVILLASLWGAGYLIAWAAKWVIGSILLHRNLFVEASQKVSYWASDYTTIESRNVDAIYVLRQWTKRLVLVWPVIIVSAVVFVTGIIKTYRRRRHLNRTFVTDISSILVPTFIPIAWVLLARAHSFAHQWFSFRHLVVSLFGGFLLLWYLNRDTIKQNVPTKKLPHSKPNKV